MEDKKVSIEPLAEHHLAALEMLSVKPEQVPYAVPNMADLARRLAPSEKGFVMCLDQSVVGFFFVDLDYASAHDFCPANGAGVRMVMVDQRAQGRGVAQQALLQLPDYIRHHYPSVAVLYLTVNCKNPGAYRCYKKCGYQDTDELYHGGPVGPQNVMRCKIS